MTNDSFKPTVNRGLRWIFGRLAFLVVIWLFFGALVWLWPWSLIVLEVLALLWCLLLIGEGTRFSLRGLLILTAGVALVVATAAWVPGPMLGGGGGRSNKQVSIEVLDESNTPVKNAKVVLTHREKDLIVVTAYKGTTNAEGVAELTCYIGGETKKSILRTWRTYDFDRWLLEAKADGYRPAEKVLSNVTIVGEGGERINFRIELELNP